jgi:hypothetical protein
VPPAAKNLFEEKDGRKRPPCLPRRLNTAVSDKPENAKHRGFCEATSLTAFGPHGKKAHNPRGMYKGVSPLYTFSFAFRVAKHYFICRVTKK